MLLIFLTIFILQVWCEWILNHSQVRAWYFIFLSQNNFKCNFQCLCVLYFIEYTKPLNLEITCRTQLYEGNYAFSSSRVETNLDRVVENILTSNTLSKYEQILYFQSGRDSLFTIIARRNFRYSRNNHVMLKVFRQNFRFYFLDHSLDKSMSLGSR